MTLISTIHINQTSPYKVHIIDDGLSLEFTTQKGIRYKIAFTEDCSIYLHNAYMFYIGTQDMPLERDKKIAHTIYSILDSFFEDNNRILLYFCDMKDHKQALRNRLFSIWYENSPKKNLFRKITMAIDVDTDMYFVSLIALKAHPQIDFILDQFSQYISELKNK